MKRQMFGKSGWLVGGLLLSFFWMAPGVLFATGVDDGRAEILEKALATMWVQGLDDTTRQTLEGLTGGPPDLVGVKALFHLGCGALLQGRPEEARSVLSRLEKAGGVVSGSQTYVAALKRYVVGQEGAASETLSLDFKDMPIPEIIRLLAAKTNRAVVVDEGVERRNVTLHLPQVKFDEVMKILAALGNFRAEAVGDILVVRPQAPSLGEGPANDGNISIDVNNADIRDILRMVAATGKFNLVFHKSVRGQMTIRLQKVAPLEALRLVAKAGDFVVEKDGDSYLILGAGQGGRALGGKEERAVIPLQFLDPKDALSLLNHERISGCAMDPDTRGIVFTGDPASLEKVRQLLQEQDRPQKPVLIATKIWEFPNPGEIDVKTFGEKSHDEKLKLANLVAAPRILTLAGRSAKIEIGEKKDDQQLKSGVELSFFPVVLPSGMFQIDLHGTIKTESSSGGKPMESTRKISSTFVVKPGARFTYEVQGGILPTLLEVVVTQPD